MKNRFKKDAPMASRSGMVAAGGVFYKMLLTMPPEPRQQVKEKGVGRPIKIPDETVLALRRRSEIDRVPLQGIVKEYPELDPTYIRRILEYAVRTNLRLPTKK